MARLRPIVVAILAATFVAAVWVRPSGGATLPSGFGDTLVASVAGPTALAFTPDGRLLVATQAGRLYVVRGGVIGSTPALDLSAKVCANSERGLLGVAVDPSFAANGFVYLYYTAETATGTCPQQATPSPSNRVSRFVVSGSDVVDPASELALIDGVPSFNGNHNAGDLAFGQDGKLYVSIGDGGCDYAGNSGCAGSNDASRDIDIALGKILRINTDGSVPVDNPYAGESPNRCADDGRTDVGKHCPETFASGFRNPFRMAFAADGRLYVNDVGQGASEEIDEVQPGKDYGWNVREGHCVNGSTTSCAAPPIGLTDPIYDYTHSTGCKSITGGAFVPDAVWPVDYRGDYLFADYVCGKIIRLDQTGGGSASDFVTGLGSNSAVHLEFGPDNALYYTTYAGGGQVRRIVFDAGPPPPSDDRFLSDLSPTSATNGYGPVERDASNGQNAAGDGRTITLNGVPFSKGLGVHAASNVIYSLGASFVRFEAQVGVDDECKNTGSVVFQVFVDGAKRFDSGTMTPTSATKAVSVDTTGKQQLRVVVTNAGDGGTCDHADWAAARLIGTTSTSTTSTTTTSTTTTSTSTTSTSTAPSSEFLSDLSPTSATNGYGPVERDASNGQNAAGDGRTITLNGVPFSKGLGVHAASNVIYSLGASFVRFEAQVGVDDECKNTGSVVFQVFVDGAKRFDSGTMTPTSATKAVSVDTTGKQQLRVVVTNAGDGGACDHADWAAARLTRA